MKTLIIIFEEKERILLLKEQISDYIYYEGKHFFNKDKSVNIGFYDWLRNEKRQVIGIRSCPFPDYNFPFSLVSGYTSTKIINESYIEIFFSEDKVFIEDFSSDQCFGVNKLLFSERNILLSYDLSWLEQKEVDGLVELFMNV